MKVLFRVDSSYSMGTGHVMRCLTLADALQDNASQTIFACRSLPGHSIGLIEGRGYEVAPIGGDGAPANSEKFPWLGVSQGDDLAEFLPLCQSLDPDLTIVDHYGIDAEWHKKVAPHSSRIMAIDELANRHLDCDILLDQTYGRPSQDYSGLVQPRTRLLLGSDYALLRPEFSALRQSSLDRRDGAAPKRIMVSMGGTDFANYTGRVINALVPYLSSHGLDVEVVMGGMSPSLKSVREQIAGISGNIKLSVDLADMASAIAKSDLVIGAAGTSAWERCCLGVPTLLFVVAENQKLIAKNLEHAGAAKIIENPEFLGSILFDDPGKSELDMLGMSRAAARIIDGTGASRVAEEIMRL